MRQREWGKAGVATVLFSLLQRGCREQNGIAFHEMRHGWVLVGPRSTPAFQVGWHDSWWECIAKPHFSRDQRRCPTDSQAKHCWVSAQAECELQCRPKQGMARFCSPQLHYGQVQLNKTSSSSDRSIQVYCLAIIAVAVVTYMVYWLRPVLVPFVVALFVVSGITPILELVEKYLRVNRLVASVFAFLCGILILFLLSFCLWGSVQQLAVQGKAYRARVSELLTSLQEWMPMLAPEDEAVTDDEDLVGLEDPIDDSISMGEALGANGPTGPNQPPGDALAGIDTAGAQVAMDLASFRSAIDRLIRLGLSHVSSALYEFFSTSVIVLIYVFFLILGSKDSPQLSPSIKAIDEQVRGYLLLKTVISLVTGLAFGAALWLLGVPMALTFGLLAFLMNYIPNVGPVVASLLPVPFILLSPEGSIWWMILAITITMGIQIISGSVIEPKVMGESSDLHPVVVLLALMFWGMMWGITGMFLATPITAGMKIVLEGYPSTQPFADLLAGRFDRFLSREAAT